MVYTAHMQWILGLKTSLEVGVGYGICMEHKTIKLNLRGKVVLRVRWNLFDESMELGETQRFFSKIHLLFLISATENVLQSK